MEVSYYEKEPGRTNVVGRIGSGTKSIGFVSHMDVVPPGELTAAARATAEQILARGPLAVRLATLVVRTGMDADQRTGQVVERLAQALLYTTEDKREGTTAFVEKRPAAFRGA